MPGPYPVETTTVNATVDISSTVSASSEESSSSQANIDTQSENSTSSEASNEVGSTSDSSYLLEIFKRLLEKQEINKTKEEEIIDKILSDKEFTKKLLDKLKLRQNE